MSDGVDDSFSDPGPDCEDPVDPIVSTVVDNSISDSVPVASVVPDGFEVLDAADPSVGPWEVPAVSVCSVLDVPGSVPDSAV